jgi:hypothetical protein
MVLSQTNVASNVGSTSSPNQENNNKPKTTSSTNTQPTGTRGYISNSQFVPSPNGKYVQDSSGKVTDTSTGQTSGASYSTKQVHSVTGQDMISGVVYDAKGNAKSYTSDNKQITIGSKSDTTQAQQKANISISQQYSQSQTTPSEAFRPQTPAYEGASIQARLLGTDKMSFAKPSIEQVGQAKDGIVGVHDSGRQQSYMVKTSNIKTLEADNQVNILIKAQNEAHNRALTKQTQSNEIVSKELKPFDKGYLDYVKGYEKRQENLNQFSKQIFEYNNLTNNPNKSNWSPENIYKGTMRGGIGLGLGLIPLADTLAFNVYSLQQAYKRGDVKFGIPTSVIEASKKTPGETLKVFSEPESIIPIALISGVAGLKAYKTPATIKGDILLSKKETIKIKNDVGQSTDIPKFVTTPKKPVVLTYETTKNIMGIQTDKTLVKTLFYPEGQVKRIETSGNLKRVYIQDINDIKATEYLYKNSALQSKKIVQGTDYVGVGTRNIKLFGTQTQLTDINKVRIMENTIGINKAGDVFKPSPYTKLEQVNIRNDLTSNIDIMNKGKQGIKSDIITSSSFKQIDEVGAQNINTIAKRFGTQNNALINEANLGFKTTQKNIDIVLANERKILPKMETNLLGKEEVFKFIEKNTGKEAGSTEILGKQFVNPDMKTSLKLKYDVSGKITLLNDKDLQRIKISDNQGKINKINKGYNDIRNDIINAGKKSYQYPIDKFKQSEIPTSIKNYFSSQKARETPTSNGQVLLFESPESKAKPFVSSDYVTTSKLNIPEQSQEFGINNILKEQRNNKLIPSMVAQLKNISQMNINHPKSLNNVDNKYSLININKPITKTTNDLIQNNVLKNDLNITQINNTIQQQQPTTKQQNELKQLQQQEQILNTQQITEQVQKQQQGTSRFNNQSFNINFKIPELKIPLIPTKTTKEENKKKKRLFNVTIGKQGNKIFKEYKGVELDQAKNLLSMGLKTTLAASGKITDESGQSVNLGMFDNTFTSSKSDPNRYVQINKYRLSSGGEKAQIKSYKNFFGNSKRKRNIFNN